MLLTLVCVMLLAGCGGLQAPKVEKPNLYVLDARASARAVQIKRDLVLAVSMPRARSGFDTPQMVYLRQPQKLEYFAVNRWANAPASCANNAREASSKPGRPPPIALMKR